MVRSPKATSTDILAKFPGPVILYPSKLHLVHLFIVSIVFFFCGVFFLQAGNNTELERAALIGCVVMGGTGAPIFALSFLPRAAFLRLDGGGFEYANCFHKQQFAWSDVKDFGVGVLPYGVRMVSFRAPWHHHFFTTYLPDSYGFTIEETSALMGSWRNLAIPSASPKLMPKDRPLSSGRARNDEQLLISKAEKLGRTFAHVTALQWVGMAIIGLSFVAALSVFFTSMRASHLTRLTEPSPPMDVLSDHGPKRVACDFKWSALQQRDPGAYPAFLQRCMSEN